MKAFNGLEAPGLTELPFVFSPHDRLPVGRQHQSCARAGNLDSIPARFVDVQEERLLNGVFVGSRLDVDAVLLFAV